MPAVLENAPSVTDEYDLELDKLAPWVPPLKEVDPALKAHLADYEDDPVSQSLGHASFYRQQQESFLAKRRAEEKAITDQYDDPIAGSLAAASHRRRQELRSGIEERQRQVDEPERQRRLDAYAASHDLTGNALIDEPYAALTRAGGTLVGLASRVGDVVAPTGLPVGRQAADEVNRTVEEMGESQGLNRQDDLSPWLSRMYGNVAQSGIEMMSTPGGSYAKLAMSGLSTANKAATTGADAGLSGSDLARYVAEQAAPEVLVGAFLDKMGLGGAESVAAGKLTSKTFKELQREFIKQGAAEGLEEGTTQALQDLSNKLSINPNLTLKEALLNIAEAAASGTALTGALTIPKAASLATTPKAIRELNARTQQQAQDNAAVETFRRAPGPVTYARMPADIKAQYPVTNNDYAAVQQAMQAANAQAAKQPSAARQRAMDRQRGAQAFEGDGLPNFTDDELDEYSQWLTQKPGNQSPDEVNAALRSIERERAARQQVRDLEATVSPGTTPATPGAARMAETPPGVISPTDVAEPWTMTQAEFVNSRPLAPGATVRNQAGIDFYRHQHAEQVRDALVQGKPVPEHIVNEAGMWFPEMFRDVIVPTQKGGDPSAEETVPVDEQRQTADEAEGQQNLLTNQEGQSSLPTGARTPLTVAGEQDALSLAAVPGDKTSSEAAGKQDASTSTAAVSTPAGVATATGPSLESSAADPSAPAPVSEPALAERTIGTHGRTAKLTPEQAKKFDKLSAAMVAAKKLPATERLDELLRLSAKRRAIHPDFSLKHLKQATTAADVEAGQAFRDHQAQASAVSATGTEARTETENARRSAAVAGESETPATATVFQAEDAQQKAEDNARQDHSAAEVAGTVRSGEEDGVLQADARGAEPKLTREERRRLLAEAKTASAESAEDIGTAIKDAKAAWSKIGRRGSINGKKLESLPEADFIRAVGRLAHAVAKHTANKFREFIVHAVNAFDAAFVRENAELFQDAWEAQGKDEPSDVKAILDDLGKDAEKHEAAADKAADKSVEAETKAPNEAASEEDAIAIKNAHTEARLVAMGLPPHKAVDVFGHDWKSLVDQARTAMANNATVMPDLIRRINDTGHIPSDLEDMMVGITLIDMDNAFAIELDQYNEAIENGDATTAALLLPSLECRKQDIAAMSEIANRFGTAQGRALVARKALIKRDFTLARMTQEAEAAAGRKFAVNGPEMKRLDAQQKDIAAKKGPAEEADANQDEEASQAAATQAVQQTVADVAKNAKAFRGSKEGKAARKELDAKLAEKANKQRREKGTPSAATQKAKAAADVSRQKLASLISGELGTTGFTPELLSALTEHAVNSIKAKVLTFQDFIADLLQTVSPDRVRKLDAALQQTWTDAKAKHPKIDDPSAVGPIVDTLAKPAGVVSEDAELVEAARRAGITAWEEFTKLMKSRGVSVQKQLWDASEADARPKPPKGFDKTDAADVSGLARALQRFFVEAGMRDRDAIIAKVHEALQVTIPGITKRETRDAISRYGQAQAMSQAEIAKFIRDINAQMQKMSQIEDIEAGKGAKRTGLQRDPVSDALRHLQKQVNEAKRIAERNGTIPVDTAGKLRTARQALITALQNRIKDLQTETTPNAKGAYERIVRTKTVVLPDAEIIDLKTKLDALKELEKQVFPDDASAKAGRRYEVLGAKWLDRAARGDFGPRPPRVEIKLNPADLAKKTAYTQAKQTYYRDLEKYKRQNRTKLEKFGGALAEVWNVPRNTETTGELSFVGRQGKFAFLAHPILTGRALWRTLGILNPFTKPSTAARKVTDIETELSQNDNFTNGVYKWAGLPNSEAIEKGELVNGRWFDYVPYLGTHLGPMGSAFLMLTRAKWIDSMVASMAAPDGTVTKQQAQHIGNFVNVATGKGFTIPNVNTGTKVANFLLNNSLFSFTFAMSRLQLAAGPFTTLLRTDMDARTKKAIAKEYLRMGASLAVYYALLVAAFTEGADDDEEKPVIDTDWTSSNFLKIRIGNTRIDPFAGLQQAIVLIGRTVEGRSKSAAGKVTERVDPRDLLADWWSNKSHPTLAGLIDWRRGKDRFTGEPVTAESLPKKLAPITWGDIADVEKAMNIKQGTLASVLAAVGEGVSTYDAKKKK